MGQWLKQSTAVTIQLGPFLDKNDGVTEKTALTLDVELSKNGAAFANRNSATAITHDVNGWYRVELDATDTNTLGRLTVKAHDAANALPVWAEYMIVPANVWDSFFGADKLQVDVTEMAAGVLTASAIAADAISAGKIAADAIGASELAADAIAEIADAVWDEARSGHTAAGTFGEGVASVSGNIGGNVVGSIGSLAAQAKADVNAEVDAALDTAVPAIPTANSINERIKTLDDLLQAGGSGDAAVIKAKVDVLHDTRIPGVVQPQSGDAFARLATYRLGELLSAPLAAPAAQSLFGELTEDNGGMQRFTAAALSQAPAGGGGGGGTVTDITQAALAKFASVNTGQSSAVAGSVCALSQGTQNIQVGPVLSAIAPGNRVGGLIALEMHQNSAKQFSLTVLDGNGAPINLLGKTLRFVVFDRQNPPAGVFDVEQAGITITGSGNNIALVAVPATASAIARDDLNWVLWDVNAAQALLHGTFRIVPAVANVP